MISKALLAAVILWFIQVRIGLAAESKQGLFVLLESGRNRELAYKVNNLACSKQEFVKIAEIEMKNSSGVTPVILFDDRLSLADVRNVGGLLGGIGFPVPRYFMFTEKRSAVVELRFGASPIVFDYLDFIKDPFGSIQK
jgi:hypothetical protein